MSLFHGYLYKLNFQLLGFWYFNFWGFEYWVNSGFCSVFCSVQLSIAQYCSGRSKLRKNQSCRACFKTYKSPLWISIWEGDQNVNTEQYWVVLSSTEQYWANKNSDFSKFFTMKVTVQLTVEAYGQPYHWSVGPMLHGSM